ncbi:MAG TPA: UPF0182 family protein [Gemmatimonadales bacterium]
MTPRSRRLLGAIIAAFALLFIGRWTVGLVAERWWAATLSPSAAAFVTGWQLLGLALDVGAIVVASAWFVLHALLVARTIASVQVAHRLGNLQLREAVPTRFLLIGAIAAGTLLGLIAASGAHAWREPIVLAWQGAHYDVVDPLLHDDLGVFTAQLPAWDLAIRFLVLVVVLGLGFCVALYGGIGAIRRTGRYTITLHPDAQRHLGGLLAGFALVIALGYLLAPYHLAASDYRSLTMNGATLITRGAQVMAGVAVATSFLTVVWSLRGKVTVLAAAWIVLGVGSAIQRFLVPALAEQAPVDGERLAMMRRFDRLAWGIHPEPPSPASDTLPGVTAIWDRSVLDRVAEQDGSVPEAATAVAMVDSGRQIPAWLVASYAPDPPGRLDIVAVADGMTTGTGEPILVQPPQLDATSRPVWRSLANPRIRPGGPGWMPVRDGVEAGGPLRRLLLAWARQEPGMLRDPEQAAVDWHLDPTERASAILPMFSWLPADLLVIGDRPVWVVQGTAVLDRVPMATRAHWGDVRVSGVVPEVICTVDVASGQTHFYLDPAADSLGASWARIIGGTVAPAATLPADLRRGLPYPPEWFDAQIAVLEGLTWNAGQRETPSGPPATQVPTWIGAATPARQIALAEPSRGTVTSIVTAYRTDGVPVLRIASAESDGFPANSRGEISRRWSRSPEVLHLRDSVTAAGDSVIWRGMRWMGGRDPETAWQPLFAISRHGTPTLLWLGTAIADHVAGGRNVPTAWAAVGRAGVDTTARAPDATAVLDAARVWMRRADSAFQRGDLTAFGRAFEALRSVLMPHGR